MRSFASEALRQKPLWLYEDVVQTWAIRHPKRKQLRVKAAHTICCYEASWPLRPLLLSLNDKKWALTRSSSFAGEPRLHRAGWDNTLRLKPCQSHKSQATRIDLQAAQVAPGIWVGALIAEQSPIEEFRTRSITHVLRCGNSYIPPE